MPLNTVCSTGTCTADIGTVDLTGWTWASADDLRSLFNAFAFAATGTSPVDFGSYLEFTRRPSAGGIEFRSVLGLIRACLESSGRRPCRPRLRYRRRQADSHIRGFTNVSRQLYR